ncbi:MAG TPA: hypothetical protein VFW40_00600 [Capsulimonadaceae bacterium]|nr:hypothetical protein [Capsulimonadaceae bacterium]
MSLTSSFNERAKYQYLLQLSNEQVRALKLGDMPTFDRILAAKRAIIDSLVDMKNLVRNDPTLRTVVEQIVQNDHIAERLIYRKMGRIRRELSEIHQFKKARRAYGRNSAKIKPGGFIVDENTPRFLDKAS